MKTCHDQTRTKVQQKKKFWTSLKHETFNSKIRKILKEKDQLVNFPLQNNLIKKKMKLILVKC
jgi:hypothetical protein